MARKFNTYKNRKQTSNKTMRIDKREIVLGLIITGIMTNKNIHINRSYSTPHGMKRSEMDKKKANMTRLSFDLEDKDLLESYHELIKSTGWLTPKNSKNGTYYEDTKKLRIYFNWVRKNRSFTIQKVMKYMYSPQLLAFLLETGEWTYHAGKYLIMRLHLSKDDALLFVAWLDEVIGLKASYTYDSTNKDHPVSIAFTDVNALFRKTNPYLSDGINQKLSIS